MATPSSITSNYERQIKEIEVSPMLSDEEKESCIFKLNHALDGTNGLNQKDKLQSVSEDVYWLTESSSRQLERYNTVLAKIDDESRRSDAADSKILTEVDKLSQRFKGGSLYGMISDAKWAIVVLGIAICALFAFRPELSSIISSCINN